MYKEILELRPYFFSLREIQDKVSLDLKLPLYWDINIVGDDFPIVTIKVQERDEKWCLLSLISSTEEMGYEEVLKCAKILILRNIEKEEKEKLLNHTIENLKKDFEQKISLICDLFNKESLNELKTKISNGGIDTTRNENPEDRSENNEGNISSENGDREE